MSKSSKQGLTTRGAEDNGEGGNGGDITGVVHSEGGEGGDSGELGEVKGDGINMEGQGLQPLAKAQSKW